MKTSSLLKKGRKLLTNPKRWAQEDAARTKNGESVTPRHPKAYCFCAVGAIERYAPETLDSMYNPDSSLQRAIRFLDDSVRGKYAGTIIGFNDAKGRKHGQVLGVYDRAIKTAEHAEAKKKAKRAVAA